MEYRVLIFDSSDQLFPQRSAVQVEHSDGKEVLLDKLGYSSTQFGLYVVPDCYLWDGILQSRASVVSTDTSQAEIGALLLERGRRYSLVLAKSRQEEEFLRRRKEETVVINESRLTKNAEKATPELVYDLGESGYFTYSSNQATPDSDDVIITSPPKAVDDSTGEGNHDSTIVIETEDEVEDPLSTSRVASRACALPKLFSHLHKNHHTASNFHLNESIPPPVHPKAQKYDIRDKISSRRRAIDDIDGDVIIISSSDETMSPSLTSSTRHRKSVAQSSDRVNGSDQVSCRDSSVSVVSQSEHYHSLSGQVHDNLVTAQAAAGINCCGFMLSNSDLMTLRPHQWLNDQIINSYMKLLVETYGRQCRVHIMSTFFYTKLSRSGYAGVERWIRKINMKKLRLLLVPVHVRMSHWSLVAVNFRAKSITYFDSLHIRNPACLKRLKSFLLRCARAQKLTSVRYWRLCHAMGIPRQGNGSDCGVFVCQFAKWLCSRHLLKRHLRSHSKIPFHQRDILRIRETMLDELITSKINVYHFRECFCVSNH